MGTWGARAFENDAALDWLSDLEHENPSFLLKPIKAVLKAKGEVDLDDSLEALAASQIIVASRYQPPKGVPREATGWISKTGFVADAATIKLAIDATERILGNSELAESWRAEGRFAGWSKSVKNLRASLQKSLNAPGPKRRRAAVEKPSAKEIVDLIIKVSHKKADDPLREKLLGNLANLSNLNKPLRVQGFNALTPLQWVASRGLVDAARLLISRGADVNFTQAPLVEPVGFAIQEGHRAMVDLLLQNGANREPALRRAVASNKPKLIELVCKRGGDIQQRDEMGRTAIHWAGYYGAEKSLRFLVKLGADVNDRTIQNDTPLHYAVAFDEKDDTKTAKALLEHGAKIDPKNHENKTPLDEANEEFSPRLVRLLRARQNS